jgi:phage shock protein PspC (stress-responsive transcriptional regulator)
MGNGAVPGHDRAMTETAPPEPGPTPPPDATSAPPPGGSFPPPHTPRRPLLRSRDDRKIAGVAGGLGRYTNVDPLVFRILLVVLAIFGGSGLLLYALAWLFVPEEGEAESEAQRLLRGRLRPRVIVAIVVGFIGLIAFGHSLGSSEGFGGLAALAAVGLAAYLIMRSDPPLATGPAAYAPPPATAPGAYGQTPGTAYTTGMAPAQTLPLPPAPSVYYGPPVPPTPPKPPKERSPLGRITVSVALLAAGLLVAWDAATSYDVPAVVVFGTVLAVIGAGLVVSAFLGRARGLIPLGILLALVTGASAAAHDVPVHAGTGERVWAPTSAATLRPTYELGAGSATLDLRHLAATPGTPLHVKVDVGAGQIRVLLPADLGATVHAHAGVGNIVLPGQEDHNGMGADGTWSDPGSGTAGSVDLDLNVGFGEVEVRDGQS